jgi:hypothetical protein
LQKISSIHASVHDHFKMKDGHQTRPQSQPIHVSSPHLWAAVGSLETAIDADLHDANARPKDREASSIVSRARVLRGVADRA